jgi:hypothetical protein
LFSFLTPDAERWGYVGELGYLYPWVLAPSNFLYDTRFQSWWMIESPEVVMPSFAAHGTAQGHILEVFPEVNADSQTMCKRYDSELESKDYCWTSQPIVPEMFRAVTVREVNVLVSARGDTPQLTVTILGLSDSVGNDVTESHTINLQNTALAVVYRIPFSIDCQSITISLEAQGDGVTDADDDPTASAPVIHSFRIGYQTIANTPMTVDAG